jgi:hypothetical protein
LPPSVDPLTCSPDDLSAIPVILQTFATDPAPIPNNLSIPPGTYQLTSMTTYCPPGSSGYPPARYKQAVVIANGCSLKVTFRGAETPKVLRRRTSIAGLISYSGTEVTVACPAVSRPSPELNLTWTINGTTLLLPTVDNDSATLPDGSAGKCQTFGAFERM